jgi:AcrR family transcriptional regulator
MNQNALETRNNLLEAFLRIYELKSISQITVKEVCTLAGYNRTTFYNHFDDIPSMQHQIENETLSQIEDVVGKFSEQEIFQSDTFFSTLKEIYNDKQQLMSVLMTRPDSHFPQKLKGLMERVITGHIHDLSIVDKRKLEVAISYHFSAILGVITHWLKNRDTIEMADVIDYVKEFSHEGILTVIKKML